MAQHPKAMAAEAEVSPSDPAIEFAFLEGILLDPEGVVEAGSSILLQYVAGSESSEN